MVKLNGLLKEAAGTPPASVLHSVRWRRVVLDEAHNIKDKASSTAKAAFALDARFRWCLSGTPLQNRVGELYSLIRFLRAYPFAHAFCKKDIKRGAAAARPNPDPRTNPCSCCVLEPPGRGANSCAVPGCGHSGTNHSYWWNRFIANPRE